MDDNQSKIQCPNCDYELDINLTTNLTSDSQALEHLFDGSLNVMVCDQCQVSFLNDVDLIFKDDNQSYYIYYMPNDSNEDPEKLVAQMGETLKVSDLDEGDYPDFRLTLTRQSFIEKIALHIEELDDKIIEYLKFQMFFSENNLDRENNELYYNFSISNEEILNFTVFDKREKKALHEINLPRKFYAQISSLAEEGEKIDLDKIFPTYLVHQIYIKSE